MQKYIKYSATPLLVCFGILFALKGEYWMWVFQGIFAFIIIGGDIFLGDDTTNHKFKSTKILNFFLYLNLPLIFVAVIISIWMVGDMTLPEWGNSLIANRKNTIFIHHIGYIVSIGLLVASAATNIGHELTHRKRNRFDMFIGNWLLALTWDCAYAIEHVYGHHKNVATIEDPATAKRGQNPYSFILHATLIAHKNAWKIEHKRLLKKDKKTISIQNRMLIGYGRSMLISIWALYISGWAGLIMFIFIAMCGKIMLEGVNYMEHYGLIRELGAPILPKHSWNTNKRISSVFLYNLTRHSSHHENASLEYWELKAYPKAPQMPGGYLSSVYLVLFTPWVYHRMMASRLKDWDKNYANNEERKLANIQNQNSGLKYLMA